MALNLPKISAPTVGEASRLNVMKAPKAPKLVPFGMGGGKKPPATPKTAAAAAGDTNPYDTFNVSDPYAPGQINQIAQTGYNADVTNANKLAGMGYLTPDQETARAASQASNAQSIAQALQQQLAGVQTATVAQGNQGGSVLAGQNAATAAAGNPVASATGAPNVGVTGAGGAQAVLGSQTAAGGNYLGSLEAAALSSGATNAGKAYATGQSNIADDQANIQKTLASLLSGVTPVSSRESTMIGANSQVDAANKQTELTIYTGIQNQAAQAAALGEKKLSDQYTLQAKNYATTLSNSTKKALGIAADTTKVATTQITANAGVKKTKLTQQGANTRNANTTATSTANNVRTNQTSRNNNVRTNDARATTSGTDAKGNKTYSVTVTVPKKTTAKDPITGLATTKVTQTTVPKKYSAKQWAAFLASGPQGKRRLSILGVPEGSKVKYGSVVGQ